MGPINRESYQLWSFRLCLITAAVVILLSWMNGLGLKDLVIRGGVSFGIMFIIFAGIINLFEKTGASIPENIVPGAAMERGALLDIAVGDDQSQEFQSQNSYYPGQVDQNLSVGLQDSRRQADIVRRMGWEDDSK